MSSSADFIASLQLAQENLYRFGGSLLMFLGTISCVFNIFVFIQKNLRKSPCSICLIAFNAASCLLLYLSLLPAILQIGYNIEPGAYNLVYCRIRYYLGFLLACLPPFYLILASIDRALITSVNVRIRQWSNRCFIYKCIFILTLFWALFHIHALFYTNILQFAPNYFVCYFHTGLYSALVSYYTLIVNGMIPLFLYSFFGLLTVRNMHRRRVRPFISSRPSRNRIRAQHNSTVSYRKDRQFIRMLLTEIMICIIFDFIHPSVLLYTQITQYQTKSEEQMAIEQFIISISTFSLHVPFCISFYTNFIVSKTFRKVVKNIILKNRIIARVQPF
jgi:hypothetical protein